MMRTIAVLAIGLCAASTAGVRAADQPIAGHSLDLREAAPSTRRLRFDATDPHIVLPALPFTDDARLRVWTAGGEFGFQLTATWHPRRDGRALKTADNSFHIQNGKIRVKTGLPGISLDEPAQGSIGVSLTMGDTRYCAVFGGITRADEPGRFQARDAPPPPGCPDLCAGDFADPTVSISQIYENFEEPNHMGLIADPADDRELHHVDYAAYELVGCPSGTTCDAPCWARGGALASLGGPNFNEGTFVGPECTKCVEATARAFDSCGRSSAEAVARAQVSCTSSYCCS